MSVRFSSSRMVPELVQPFWAALQAGEFLTDAAAVAGTHRWRGLEWLREAGGVRPRRGRDLKGRCLTFAEREEIALGRAAGESIRSIATRLGRSPSTAASKDSVLRFYAVWWAAQGPVAWRLARDPDLDELALRSCAPPPSWAAWPA